MMIKVISIKRCQSQTTHKPRVLGGTCVQMHVASQSILSYTKWAIDSVMKPPCLLLCTQVKYALFVHMTMTTQPATYGGFSFKGFFGCQWFRICFLLITCHADHMPIIQNGRQDHTICDYTSGVSMIWIWKLVFIAVPPCWRGCVIFMLLTATHSWWL